MHISLHSIDFLGLLPCASAGNHESADGDEFDRYFNQTWGHVLGQRQQQLALQQTVDTHGRTVPYSKQRRQQVPKQPMRHHATEEFLPPVPMVQHGLRSSATSQLGALLSTGLAHGAARHTRVPTKTSRL